MKQAIHLFAFLFLSTALNAQVGIGTVSPDASSVFDITATDKGILIPRVALTNVSNTTIDGSNTAAAGLLIWNTNAAVTGGSGIGYYYFNGTSWDRIVTTATTLEDADWYEEGTTTAPDNIGDDKYTSGHLAIGKNTADYRLEVTEATTSATRALSVTSSYNDTGVLSTIYNESTFNGSNSGRGLYTLMGGSGTGAVTGSYNNIQNSGDGTHYGSFNGLAGAGAGIQRGTFNQISNTGDGVHAGTYNSLSGTGSGQKYGSFNSVQTAAGGTHYAVFGQSLKSGSYAGYFSGNVYVSGVFTNPSDRKLKYNIQMTSDVLAKLNQLKVRDYRFKVEEADKFGFPKGDQTGFIAQELEAVFPELVKDETLPVLNNQNDKSEDFRNIKSVNYLGMVPYLTKAIQEQQEIIESQQEQIDALKNEIEQIKQMIKTK